MMHVKVYTDGSSRPRTTKAAGWGFVAITEGTDKKVERYGHIPPPSTNNVAELLAVIKAVETFNHPGIKLTVYSDSQYVVKGISEWVFGWKSNNWRTNAGQPVKNVELWKQLDALNNKSITYQWVKGHAGNELNERADRLANMGSDNI